MFKIFLEILSGIFKELIASIKIFDFKQILLLIVFIPIIIIIIPLCLLLLFIFIIIDFPLSYPRYIKSDFYKDFKIMYSMGVLSSTRYLFYNYILANDIDIDFFYDHNKDTTSCFYMKKNDIIYLLDDFYAYFNDNNELMVCLNQDGAGEIEISKYIKEQYKNYEKPIKIVVKESNIPDCDIDNAYQSDYLYIYNNLDNLRIL